MRALELLLTRWFSFPDSTTADVCTCWVSLNQLDPYIEEFFQTLADDEKIRVGGFHFAKDRKRFTIARGMLRQILASYLHTEPGAVRFCYGKNGKPKLAHAFGDESIEFSLSHSEGIALYGFCKGCPIGVDIEYIHEIPEMDLIAKKFFSTRESEGFRRQHGSKKVDAFYKCWTRKEAFIKATGEGLSRPLDMFDVSVIPDEPANLLSVKGDAREASRWFIRDVKPAPDYAAAFAVRSDMFGTKPWRWGRPGKGGLTLNADRES